MEVNQNNPEFEGWLDAMEMTALNREYVIARTGLAVVEHELSRIYYTVGTCNNDDFAIVNRVSNRLREESANGLYGQFRSSETSIKITLGLRTAKSAARRFAYALPAARSAVNSSFGGCASVQRKRIISAFGCLIERSNNPPGATRTRPKGAK